MKHIIHRGAGILLAVGALSVVATTFTYFTFRSMTHRYSATQAQALTLQTNYLAKTSIDIAIYILKSIPEQYIQQYKILRNPPSLKVKEECNEQEVCRLFYINYSITIADGKLNLNNLVRNDDEVNQSFRFILSRLFKQLKLPEKNLYSLIDWIDQNDSTGVYGAEQEYYLERKRKIKNNYLFSLPEINLVRDFEYIDLYSSRAPKDWEPDAELELYLSTEDWILVNNVDAYLPYRNSLDGKININAAPYFVLLSLSDFINKKEVKQIMRIRNKKNNYISDLEVLKPVLEKKESHNDLNLYEELVGTGGNLSGQLRTKTHFYEIIANGIIVQIDRNSDEQRIISQSKIRTLWDRNNSHLINYVLE